MTQIELQPLQISQLIHVQGMMEVYSHVYAHTQHPQTDKCQLHLWHLHVC